MRVLIAALILALTSHAAMAGGPPVSDHCPIAYRKLSTITRYCEALREEVHAGRKFCIYDCLINKDAMIVAPNQSCPMLARQRLYGNGVTMLLSR